MFPKNGYIFDMTIGYEWNDFMEGIALNEDYGTYGSVLKPNNTGRFDLTFNWYNYIKKFNFSLENSIRIAYLLNDDVDDFFHFFGGGLPGLKGYTFYDRELTGRGLINRSVYIRKMILDKRFAGLKDFVSFDKLSLGFVFQYGDAFPINKPKFSSGFELRSRGFLFYGYPAAVTFEHHYPITIVNNDVLSFNFNHGKSYFKLLFDF